MREDHHTLPDVNIETHHEESEVDIRVLFWIAAIFIAFAIVTHFALWGLFRFLVVVERGDVREPITAIARAPNANIPSEPRLQPFPSQDPATKKPNPPNTSTPVADMQAMRTAEDRVLRSYGWVDQQKGLVQLPIDVAMKMVVERGLPLHGDQPGGPAAQPATASQGSQEKRP
jgi:hypothetical protein